MSAWLSLTSVLFVNRLKDARKRQFKVPLEERRRLNFLTFNNAVLNRFVWKILFSYISSLIIPQLLQMKPVSVGRLRSLQAALTHFKALLSEQVIYRLSNFPDVVFVCGRNLLFCSAGCDISVLPHPSPLPHLREKQCRICEWEARLALKLIETVLVL